MFLRNAWYAAGWSTQFGRALAHRTMLNENILLFRKEDGQLAAISNICPHRFAPLSMGTLVGDHVMCGYHGLEFNAAGECVRNPHGTHRISRRANIKSYAIRERQGIAWLWPGDPELASDHLLPHFEHLELPNRKTLYGETTVEANYELIVDNLLDPTHANWVHRNFAQVVEGFLESEPDIRVTQRRVESHRWFPNSAGPAFFMRHFENPTALVDHWMTVGWQAPSLCTVAHGVTLAGRPREEGFGQVGLHLITPISERRSVYYFCHTRNFRVDDTEADKSARLWQQAALQEQDKPILEAVQSVMGDRDLEAMRPLMLHPDTAAMRARHALVALIKKERTRAAPSRVAEHG